MHLRTASAEEFSVVRDFYWALIDEMKEQNAAIGWKKGIYPTDAFLADSIRKGELYVLDGGDGYAACVVVNSAYNEGYDGCPWRTDCARRRTFSSPTRWGVRPAMQGQGLGKIVVGDILALARARGKKAVRLDILAGNTAAERLYTAMGFRYVQAKPMFYEDTGRTEYVMYELVL